MVADLPEVVGPRDTNPSDSVGFSVSKMTPRNGRGDLKEACTEETPKRDLLSFGGANVVEVEQGAWECSSPEVRGDRENTSGNGNTIPVDTVARYAIDVHLQEIPIIVQWLAHKAVCKKDAD